MAAGRAAGSDHRDAAAALARAQSEDGGSEPGPGNHWPGACTVWDWRGGGSAHLRALTPEAWQVDRWLDGRVSPQVEVLWLGEGLIRVLRPERDWTAVGSAAEVGLGWRRGKCSCRREPGPQIPGRGLGPEQRPTLSQPFPAHPTCEAHVQPGIPGSTAPATWVHNQLSACPLCRRGLQVPCRRSRPLRGVTGKVLNNSRLSLGPLRRTAHPLKIFASTG